MSNLQGMELSYIPSASQICDQIQDDECVVFTHIPKAAGTTLDRLLKGVGMVNQLPWKRAYGTVYDQYLGEGKRESLADFLEWKEAARQKVRILTGHVPFGIHEHLPRKAKYVTILRDPVSRTVSHYKMGISRGGWSADDSMESVFERGGLVSDVQVRMLAGVVSAEETVTQQTLDTALENLSQHYMLVGFSNTFNEFTSLLLGYLGAPNALLGNEQSARVELSDEKEQHLKHIAQEFNRWDSMLYEQAEAIAQQKSAQFRNGAWSEINDKQQNTLVASSQVRIQNKEYSIIQPNQFDLVIKKLFRSGVEIKT